MTFDEDVVRVGSARRSHLNLKTEGESVCVKWVINAGPLQVDVTVPFAVTELVDAETSIRQGLANVLKEDLPPFKEWIVDDAAAYGNFFPLKLIDRVEQVRDVGTALRSCDNCEGTLEWAKDKGMTNRLLNPSKRLKKEEYRRVRVTKTNNEGLLQMRSGKNVLLHAKGLCKVGPAKEFTQNDVRVHFKLAGVEASTIVFGLSRDADESQIKELVQHMHCVALDTVAPFAATEKPGGRKEFVVGVTWWSHGTEKLMVAARTHFLQTSGQIHTKPHRTSVRRTIAESLVALLCEVHASESAEQ